MLGAGAALKPANTEAPTGDETRADMDAVGDRDTVGDVPEDADTAPVAPRVAPDPPTSAPEPAFASSPEQEQEQEAPPLRAETAPAATELDPSLSALAAVAPDVEFPGVREPEEVPAGRPAAVEGDAESAVGDGQAALEPDPAAANGVTSRPEPEPAPEPLAAAPEPLAAAPEPLAAAPEPLAAAPEPLAAAAQPAPAPRRPPVPGPAGSVDLRVVATTAGAALPRGGGPDQRIPGAPVVAGTLCARGHLNRPGLTVCARCRTVLPDGSKDQVSGTRPPLGVLVGDDGGIYRLDRGYLVGSTPGQDPTVGGGLARPLVLHGSDVSGSHAELRLSDWDVLIVDRGSAAGTCVFEPGASEWARLNPFEPRVLPPGTHVAFGQRVMTFLSPWIPQS